MILITCCWLSCSVTIPLDSIFNYVVAGSKGVWHELNTLRAKPLKATTSIIKPL